MSYLHTPGPWELYGRSIGNLGGVDVRACGSKLYLATALTSADYRTHAETLANARLIAAAPDMLETLNAALTLLRNPDAEAADADAVDARISSLLERIGGDV